MGGEGGTPCKITEIIFFQSGPSHKAKSDNSRGAAEGCVTGHPRSIPCNVLNC